MARYCGELKVDNACGTSMQAKLSKDGLYAGPLDGKVDAKTVRALQAKLKQEGHAVKVDGIAGKETVTALQEELRRRGFYNGQIDGIPGKQTREAVRQYFGQDGIGAHAHTGATHPQGAIVTPKGAGQSKLSVQEQQVGAVAAQNGDKTYLMVDKIKGRIILFENGRPTYSAPALTGASLADRIPSAAFKETLAQQRSEDKVTPAGRFTVSKERDAEFGDTLTINEVKGKDWRIAIHRVYLGTPSEHREQRLHSSSAADKHISFGCINVDPQTVDQLMHHLHGKQPVPLYILPQDPKLTAQFFPLKSSVAQTQHMGMAHPGT